MILNDCPVGSVVRLVLFNGERPRLRRWIGEFEVKQNEFNEKYIINCDGTYRFVGGDSDYQFEIVTPVPSASAYTIILNGKTYKLTPHTERQQITIDGVVYDMEEIG